MTGNRYRDEGIIKPSKNKRDPIVPVDAILAMVSEDLNYIISLKRLKTRSMNMNIFKLHLADDSLGENFSVSGPFIGAPQAVMGMEKLIALGAKRFWALGWCGSLQPFLKIGDLVVPTHGFSEEGTSMHYPVSEKHPPSDEKQIKLIEKALEREGLPFHKGPVWTTDAPYRETPSKIRAFQSKGALAVEMEITALLNLGRFRQVKVAALLIVSDELYDLKWHPGFSDPVFKQSRHQACELLTNIIASSSS